MEHAITHGQRGCIYALIGKLDLREQKANLVLGASSGRTEHVNDLSKQEAIDLIKYLKSQDPDEVKCEEVRRAIISMAHLTGYRTSGTTKVDMEKLDNWCKKYGKFKKALNSHTLKELHKLQWQFKQYYEKELRKY